MIQLYTILFLVSSLFCCKTSAQETPTPQGIKPHFINRGPVIIPLHQAALRGNIDLMYQAIRRGQDVNEVDDRGNTAIFYAILSGSKSAVQFLMEYRPDLQIKNRGIQDEQIATAADQGVPTTIPVRGVGQFYLIHTIYLRYIWRCAKAILILSNIL